MANRYWVGGNANWDATAGTKWATTSGGAGGAAVPTASDDVFLDNGAGTGNVTVSSTSVAKSLTCTGYVGTFTMNAQLTVSGNVTFVAGMTLAGSSNFIINEAATLTSNGKTISFPLLLSPATSPGCTFTLADDWTNTSTVTIGSAASTTGCVINGNKFYCTNLTSTAASTRTVSGTTEFIMNATGTLSGTTNFQNNLTINTTGTITMGNLVYGGNTFKRTAGTVTVTAGTTLTVTSLNTTFDLSDVTLANVGTIGGSSPVYTLVSDFTVSGTYSTAAAAPNWNTSTGKKLYLATLLAGASCILQGTATIEFYTTGSWSSGGANAQVKNNVVFNTGASTFTISGNIYYNTGTMTYTSGTIVTTSSTLNIASSVTLNTADISWNNVIVTSTNPTLTINSLFNITGTLTTTGVSGTLTFAGTTGFTAANWTNTTGGMTINLVAGVTYTITTSVTLLGTLASPIVFKSSTASSYAIFTLNSGVTQSIGFLTTTDVDSSAGQTVWNFQGTLTRTLNWSIPVFPLPTISYTFLF